MDDIERTEAATLLGKIGRLYTDSEVLDVRPVIGDDHEMLGLCVKTARGSFVVTVVSEQDFGL